MTKVPASRWVLFWAIALGGAAFDLTAKSLIFARVGEPGSPAVNLVPRILELQTSRNKGALWGFGNNLRYSAGIFAALSVLAAVAICWYLFVRGAARDRHLTIALALIMAGALGNCYDRVRLGYVRDFVYFHIDPINFRFAIFNFADNMLVAGALYLMVLALRADSSDPQPPPAEAVGAGHHESRDELN